MNVKNKKTSRPIVSKIEKSKIDLNNFSLEQVTCPICIAIVIEPVCMPCNHILCLTCFELNVSQANIACPLCRKRLSVWVRKKGKNRENLIDQNLWNAVKANFEHEVNNKREGKESQQNGVAPLRLAPLAVPGEIGREFEEEFRHHRDEFDRLRRIQEEASEKTILQMKESGNLVEDRAVQEESDRKLSLRLRSVQLQERLRSSPPPHPRTKKPLKKTSRKPVSASSPSSAFMESYVVGQANKNNERLNDTNKSRPSTPPMNHSPAFASCSTPTNSSVEIRNRSHPAEDNSELLSACEPPVSTSLLPSTSSSSSGDAVGNVGQASKQFSVAPSKSVAVDSASKSAPKLDKASQNGCENNNDSGDFPSHAKKDSRVPIIDASPGNEDLNSSLLKQLIGQESDDPEELFRRLESESRALEQRPIQERQDRQLAFKMHKFCSKVDRSKGSGDEYALRGNAAKGVVKPQRGKKRRQSTLLECLAKKQRTE